MEKFKWSKHIKYTAEYWLMGFVEEKAFYFTKHYSNGETIIIDAENELAIIDNATSFKIINDEDFIKLECINRLYELGYKRKELVIDELIKLDSFSIQCIGWDDKLKQPKENYCFYKSRLHCGIIQPEYLVNNNGHIYDNGLLEQYNKFDFKDLNLLNEIGDDYKITNGCLEKYTGNRKEFNIPEGVISIKSGCFWDNKVIEKVTLPDSLVNLGGDTFYFCDNLKEVTIPKNVKIMGNNPFSGCPQLELKNCSPYFHLENGALYNKDRTMMIYYSIKGETDSFIIPDTVRMIGKHTFFSCKRLKTITIPSSVIKVENNPFSGCDQLELINHSKAFFIKDDVIYNGLKTAVVGTLNKIKSKKLELLEGIKTINRNSFWNCNGIETIVLPESLEDIGYNPFVGCSNIKFICKTNKYKVVDDVLYNNDQTKLICYPAWKAIGHIKIPESVIELERGAFSGCNKMTHIDLRNVNLINKSSFSNCSALTSLYCSDLITFIGEWAFACCTNLKRISFYKDTFIDHNAFSQCNAEIEKRETYSNYLIESENIYTLKSMMKQYKNKIDSICIDPPYNSNIDYIGYKDLYGSYHNFIEDRIKLSYELLSEKGFLVINIDEGELNQIADICKGIFGNELVSIHRWKKKHDFFDANRVVLNPNKIQTDYEYIIVCKKSNESILKNIKQPFIEDNILHEIEAPFPETFDCFGTTSSAKDEIHEIFGTREYFSTPKPVKLMKELVRATTSVNSFVLDFFAGSGTIGQAVQELNKEDGGTRKFILVSNNESDICKNVTKKRLDIIKANYWFLD